MTTEMQEVGELRRNVTRLQSRKDCIVGANRYIRVPEP